MDFDTLAYATASKTSKRRMSIDRKSAIPIRDWNTALTGVAIQLKDRMTQLQSQTRLYEISDILQRMRNASISWR